MFVHVLCCCMCVFVFSFHAPSIVAFKFKTSELTHAPIPKCVPQWWSFACISAHYSISNANVSLCEICLTRTLLHIFVSLSRHLLVSCIQLLNPKCDISFGHTRTVRSPYTEACLASSGGFVHFSVTLTQSLQGRKQHAGSSWREQFVQCVINAHVQQCWYACKLNT